MSFSFLVGAGLSESRDFTGVQRDLRGFDQFGELCDARRAGNGCRDALALDQPGQRDDRRNGLVGGGHFIQRGENPQATVIQVLLANARSPRAFT
jgi:hypothetical protein